jgi:hypothetical protein
MMPTASLYSPAAAAAWFDPTVRSLLSEGISSWRPVKHRWVETQMRVDRGTALFLYLLRTLGTSLIKRHDRKRDSVVVTMRGLNPTRSTDYSLLRNVSFVSGAGQASCSTREGVHALG